MSGSAVDVAEQLFIARESVKIRITIPREGLIDLTGLVAIFKANIPYENVRSEESQDDSLVIVVELTGDKDQIRAFYAVLQSLGDTRWIVPPTFEMP